MKANTTGWFFKQSLLLFKNFFQYLSIFNFHVILMLKTDIVIRSRFPAVLSLFLKNTTVNRFFTSLLNHLWNHWVIVVYWDLAIQYLHWSAVNLTLSVVNYLWDRVRDETPRKRSQMSSVFTWVTFGLFLVAISSVSVKKFGNMVQILGDVLSDWF